MINNNQLTIALINFLVTLLLGYWIHGQVNKELTRTVINNCSTEILK